MEEQVLYKTDKFSIEKSNGKYFVVEWLDDEIISESLPLYEYEINPYLKNNGYEEVDIEAIINK